MIVSIPSSLHSVALVDAKVCAAIGGASVSWWFGQVAAGQAPEPVIRQPRFTRWRLQEVVAFWERYAAAPRARTAEQTLRQAKRASAAAKQQRTMAHRAESAAPADRTRGTYSQDVGLQEQGHGEQA
jgi:predicted DNA-binding transcriptional regulator AlpA